MADGRGQVTGLRESRERSPKLSLQAILMGIVVVPIVSVVCLTGYLSYRNRQQIVQTLARQMMDQASYQVQRQLRDYFTSPQAINQINAVAIQQGYITPQDHAKLMGHFWQQRFLFDQVCGAAMYVGSPDGEFTGLGWQRTDGTWRIGRAGRATGGKFHSYATDRLGKPGELKTIGSQRFDPRQRPWYQAAVQAKTATWSPVYPDFSQADLKIALSEPVYDKSGKLLAVVGVDCLFSSVADFLDQVKVGQSGEVFILELSGDLIASSSIKLPLNRNAQRFNALTIDYAPIRQTAAQLQTQFGTLATIDQPQQLSIMLERERQLVQVVPVLDMVGLDWLIVVVVPESEFIARINTRTDMTLGICLGVLGLAIVAGIVTTRRVARSMRHLSTASHQLANGKIDQPVPISNIHELAQLAASFNQMSQEIHHSHLQRENYARSLERKVQERTRALELSQERFQLAMQGANDGLWDWDLVTDEVYYSPRYKEMLGYADHELPNHLSVWLNLLHPDDRDRALAEVNRYINRHHARYELTFRMRHRDGHYLWILSRGHGAWNDMGKLVRLVGVHVDITDRKQTERAIQMEQQQLMRQNAALVELTRQQSHHQEDWRAVVRDITKAAAQTLGVERASVWLFGNSKTKLRCADLYELQHDRHTTGMELSATQCPAYFQALETDDIITAYDAYHDPRTRDLAASYLQPLGISTLLDAPIRLMGKIIGVFCLERVGIPLTWTLDDRGFARSLADLVGLAMETHQRNLVETALWDSEAKFRTLVDNIPGVVYRCLCDEHWTMTFLSSEITKLTGYPANDFIHNQVRSYASITHPDDTDFITQTIMTAVADRHPFILDYRLCCADGSQRWVYEKGQGVFDDADNLLWLDGVIFDISDRKRTEQELQVANAEMNALFNAMDDLVFVLDSNGRFVKVPSTNARRILYQPDTDRIGKTHFDIFPAETAQMLSGYVQQALTTQQTINAEYCLSIDGREVWSNARISPINDNTVVWVVRDINDRKQAERKLEQAMASADAANQAKSEFLANMSHELRSPLNAILGFAQLMSNSTTLSPDHRENITIILRSGEHLLTLINNILDLSKIEAGRITLNTIDFDLISLLQDLEAMFRLRAAEKSLTLTVDYPSDLPRHIHADQVKLRQVLINLLSNAIKFTQEGGVTLSIRGEDEGCGVWGIGREEVRGYGVWGVGCEEDITSSGSPSTPNPQPPIPHTLVFEVIDTGIGIAVEEVDRLFEAFSQTSTGKAAQEGTGLGLAISQKFVRLMGGDLSMSSNLGQGTTFQFSIPVMLAEAGTIVPEPPARHAIALAPGQPTYRILVVDDKPTNRQLLVKLLTPLGCEVREAENGEAAIACWDGWEPHLIWMDMRMPVMDGYEATRIIKSTTKGQATAIIALTASALEDQKAVILSMGCDGFVRKPFREMDIITVMEQHIGAQFIYADQLSTTAIAANDITLPLSGEVLRSLPQTWLVAFQQAVRNVDLEQVNILVTTMQAEYPALAIVLKTHIDNFQYEPVLKAVEQALSM